MTATLSATPPPALPAAPARPPRRRLASLRTIVALILREMSSTYGRSPGGYLWAVLEPVAGIALLTTILSAGFRTPALGSNFPLFYATGVLPFMMFNGLVSKLSQSLNFSRPLLAYPAVTFVDALLARYLLNLLTDLMVCFLIFGGILLLYDTRVIPDPGTICEALALTAVLALGVGTMQCYLVTRFPVWQQVWAILMRPVMILSCIFFLFESLPQPYRDWLWFNPIVHLVGLMRRGFYTTYDAPYVSPLYVLGLGVVLLAGGLLLLRRNYRRLLQR